MSTTNRQQSDPSCSLYSRRTPFTPLAILALLGLSAHVYASVATLDQPLLQGELLVQTQHGDACGSPASLPFRLHVWAVWENEQWWLWGDMAPMRLRASAQDINTADLLGWADDTPQGQAQLTTGQPPQPTAAFGNRPVGAPFTAHWHENETSKGCAFTTATLSLIPLEHETSSVSNPSTGTLPYTAKLLAHQRLLRDALATKALLQSAASVREAAGPLQSLLDLARQASTLPSARQDLSLALAWLQAGERASALRQHPQALQLLQTALDVYEPMAHQSAVRLQNAALAFSSLARAQLRARQPEQAQASLSRAFTLLDQHQSTETAAAASLHNQQGALWLRNHRASDALDSFARALAADEARQAPTIERVATLMNSAVALEELGQIAAARTVYERCQQLLASEPAGADSEQLAQWVQARLQALDGTRAGGVRSL